MSDRAAVVLAFLVALGAWWSAPVPLVVGIGLVAVALLGRWPALLCLGGLLRAAGLGHRAWAGLEPARPEGVADRTVVLVSDPEVDDGALTAIVRLDGRRLEVEVPDEVASPTLAEALAGERVAVSGRVVPVTGRPDLAVRHVAGRLLVDEAGPVQVGDPVSRVANRLRRAVVRGAAPLGAEPTALLTGVLFGDDRGQSAATTDDFRASGLSHLLAVSGQNVAFVLVVAGVALRRLGLAARFLAVLAVLGFFALLTRFEPSVLRATAMAGVAAGAAFGGREVSRPRVLALAATGLLLVDPVLVHSVGFVLSVAATAGIVTLAGRLRRRLPGPVVVAEATAVTLAAQAAVAPVLVTVFGGIPLVSLPANLLAGPAAGVVMVWGLVAGPLAGLVPGLAAVLHLPTRAALGWLLLVARTAAAVPAGELRAGHVVVLAGLGLVARRWWRGRRLLMVPMILVLLAPAVVLARQIPLTGRPVVTGAEVWRDGAWVVVRVDGRARDERVLEGLRRLGIRRVGLVVLSSGASGAQAVAEAVASRGGTTVIGPVATGSPAPSRHGPFTVEALEADPERVEWLVRVDRGPGGSVRSTGARGARSPPLRHHPSGPGDGDPQPHARLVLRPGRHLGLRRLPGRGRAPGHRGG